MCRRFQRCNVVSAARTLRFAGKHLLLAGGWNILDDNILASPEQHIRAVFDMLKRQTHRPEFIGSIEAKLLICYPGEI